MDSIYWGFTLISLCFFCALSGTVGSGLGESCSGSNDHLDPHSHRLVTDCSDHYYCTAPQNGMCEPRNCRRDEFPFGYSEQDTLPPMCRSGMFCPDEGSGCRAQVEPGEACQTNRDDQCAPAPNWKDLQSEQNSMGSICLGSVCMYTNATLNQPCILETNTYITVVHGQTYNNRIVRDNCRFPQYYCDPGRNACQLSKRIGSHCQSDTECRERNCDNGICTFLPDVPVQTAHWVYVLVILCFIGSVAVASVLLVIVHRRHRRYRYQELRQYYIDQSRYYFLYCVFIFNVADAIFFFSLRRSMIELHKSVVDVVPTNGKQSS
ncbi:hypothetical protein L218DRAFT_932835 [Marasmius fiardii PR-910]|nr:hypothetical protein L218DRAFT_932835 [Marasmius fiardii PR-910]